MKTRKEAVAAGESQYYTGLPCKRGHITYRYTVSGTCSDCLRGAAIITREAVSSAPDFVQTRAAVADARRSARLAKEEAMTRLVEVRMRAYDIDWPQIRETAIELALAAHPVLARSDVCLNRAPLDRASGTAVYRALVPPEHYDTMRQVAAAFIATRKVDTSAITARLKEAERAMATVPADWVMKP